MGDKDKRVTPQELVAFGVGLSVTIVSVVITSPIAFPFNFLISLGLGTTAGYGALKVLDPRTVQDLLEAQTNAQYRRMLQEIANIATRTSKASQSLRLGSPEVSGRLANIARMTEMIHEPLPGWKPRFLRGFSHAADPAKVRWDTGALPEGKTW